MEPIGFRGPLRAHLEEMRRHVDVVARRDARPGLSMMLQLLVGTPLAVAHAAWSRLWVMALVLVAIAAAGDPTASATTWLGSAGIGLAVVWLGLTALSLAVVYTFLLGRLFVEYRRHRSAC